MHPSLDDEGSAPSPKGTVRLTGCFSLLDREVYVSDAANHGIASSRVPVSVGSSTPSFAGALLEIWSSVGVSQRAIRVGHRI